MIRVAIADDHRLVRDGIRALLERDADIEVVGEADDGAEAVALVREVTPDVLVMDITMPGMTGLEATGQIKELDNSTAVVILSMHTDGPLIRRALAAGAAGFVLKGSVTEELLLAVRAADQGGTYLSPGASETILFEERSATTAESPADRLTNREREVLGLIGEGLTNRAVAHRLSISVKTVERHRTNLMAKLNVHSVVELIRTGIRLGLIDLDDQPPSGMTT